MGSEMCIRDRHANNSMGFKNWCTEKDRSSSLLGQLISARGDNKPLLGPRSREDDDQKWIDLLSDIPCRQEFFQYVQWHNLAFSMTEGLLRIPTMVIHYNDYRDSLKETIQKLLDFLELPNVQPDAVIFKAGKEYFDYYSESDRQAIKSVSYTHLTLPTIYSV